MSLEAGDVVLLHDGTVTPPKTKLFLCVDVEDCWFFRINTKRHWKPNFPLPLRGNEHCLDHDSFLELRGIIEYFDIEVEEALKYPHNHRGKLSDDTLRALLNYLPTVKTLTTEEQDRIIANLTAVI
jgi:hypothetical protein